MRKAGLVVWEAHQIAKRLVRPGITTGEIDQAVETFFEEQNVVPLFKGVPGRVPFPAVCCISVNDDESGLEGEIAIINPYLAEKVERDLSETLIVSSPCLSLNEAFTLSRMA